MQLLDREPRTTPRQRNLADAGAAGTAARCQPPAGDMLAADRPRGSRGPGPVALWRLGFRPFYLLASIFASASIALWGAQYAGWLTRPYLAGPIWHAHEMLFGFTLAVMTGFLFTAVRNWTQLPTPTGTTLAALAALWLGGRVLVLTPYGVAAAVVTTAFPLAVAVSILIPLMRTGGGRNLLFVGLLAALAGSEIAIHLAELHIVAFPARLGVQAALDIVLIVMTVLGGRVVPMFTANAIAGSDVRRSVVVERAVAASLAALAIADLLQLTGGTLALLLALCAAVQVARALLWQPWRTLCNPMVWILHVGCLWIPVHLALRALAEAGFVASPLATHALTVGAIGGLTLGMMTRTARGHTGRSIQAGRSEIVAFALVTAAAITRALVPLAIPAGYREALIASAYLWSAAYAVYAVRYWPILTRPRIDGKPG
jgi:uncharacterized protein involved in response to NO